MRQSTPHRAAQFKTLTPQPELGERTPCLAGETASLSDERHPFRRWTDLSHDEIVSRLKSFCRAQLANCPWIDADDVCQDVLVAMLCRNFARAFDPARSDFWRYMRGVARIACLRARAAGSWASMDAMDALASSEADPQDAAAIIEWREALTAVRGRLGREDRSALDRMLDRAAGRLEARTRASSTDSVSEHRCRRRLRRMLASHG